MPIDASHMLVDSHCHIDFREFDHDRDQVIDNAEKLGVKKIITPGVKQSTWDETIQISKEYSALEPALGLHPVFIDEHQPHHLVELDTLAKTNHIVAIGEIGLDYFDKTLDREKQKIFFNKQLIIAKQNELPAIIHNRKAHDDCLQMLTEVGVRGGIIHAFNGSIQHAQKYIEMGFYLGFGGMITFDRSTKLRTLLDKIPLEYIVLETDSPDMTVAQHRGQRNSPEYLPLIAEAVAKVKNVALAEVANTTSENVRTALSL